MKANTRWLAWGGILGPVLFTSIVIFEETLQRNFLLSIGLDPLKENFPSANALGPYGWMQTLNFIVIGLAVIAFAYGLHRGVGPGSIAGPFCISLLGIGSVLAGFFQTDLPIASRPHTFHGWIHVLAFLIATVGVLVGYFLMARRFRRDPAWRGYDKFSIAIGILALVLTIATFTFHGIVAGYAVEIPRIAWFMAVGIHLWTVAPSHALAAAPSVAGGRTSIR